MPARGTMTMRAHVQRDQAAADPFGGKLSSNWQTLHAALPCRVWHTRQRSSHVLDGDKIVEVIGLLLAVPTGTDITPKDRVVDVRDRLGTVLFPGPVNIDSVSFRIGHVIIALESIR